MTKKQFYLLLIPSALWGSSFLFMHYLSPIYGPVLTSTIRVIVGSLALVMYMKLIGEKLYYKKNYKIYFIIGILSCAVPFTLYAFAALYIPSSLSVIINSTSPMFGAIFGALLLKDSLSRNKIIGLLLGTLGVGFVSSDILTQPSLVLYLSIIACLLAAFLYGLSGAIVKKYASKISPKQLTTGSLLFAGFSLVLLYTVLSLIGLVPSVQSNNLGKDILVIIVFGIFCTSIPYIVYYKLLQEVGPLKALMVTYLMPVFGLIFGIISGESISYFMVIGLFIIFLGIYILGKKNGPVKI